MLPLIQKTLAMLIMPLGLLWLLLLGMVLWSWRLRRPGFATLLSLVWFLFTLAGNPWIGQRLTAHVERTVLATNPEKTPVFEAIFVLGGGTDLSPQGLPQLGMGGDRLAEAARLWHAGKVQILVASGTGNDGLQGDRDLGEESRSLWRGLGVPDSAIRVVPTPCYITREEIAAYKVMADQNRWTQVGLLTSASHLPRALKLAENANLKVIPLPSDFRGRPRRFRPQDVVPQLEGIRLTHTAMWEIIGKALGR